MITATESYNMAIMPAITVIRQTDARITVKSITEPVLATVSAVHGDATRSRNDQVFDGIYNTRYRYASAEPNCWKLDGSTVLQPDPEQECEVGFVTEAVSETNGDYADPPYVELTVDPVIDAKGLCIVFDILDNEYASEFDVYVEFDTDQNTTFNITGNTSAIYNIYQQFVALSLVRVTVNKWCTASKFAKITEIAFGQIAQFGPEFQSPLLAVDVIDEVDITLRTMPYGELTFEFFDTNNDFTILNPSDVTKIFIEGTTISVEEGVRLIDGSFEYLLVGTYHFSEWIKSGERKIQVKAVDLIGFISQRKALEEFGNRSKIAAFNAVVTFMENVGLDIVNNVEVSLSVFPNTGANYLDGPYAESASEQLLRLGQWSLTIPYVDNIGVLRFKALEEHLERLIDFDNMFESPKITRYEQILGIRVYYYDVTVSGDITEIATATGVYGAGTTLVFDIGYDYEVYDAVAWNGTTIESVIGFANGKYSLVVSGTGSVTVRGKAWVIGRQFYEEPNVSVTDPKAVWVEVDNPHVCTLQKATDIAQWLLNTYSRLAEIDFDWRGTPEIESLDKIVTEPQPDVPVESIIVRTEWIFDGVSKHSTKGAVMCLH